MPAFRALVLSVDVRDHPTEPCTVAYLACCTPAGRSALLHVRGFRPWCYVRLPAARAAACFRALQRELLQRCPGATAEMVRRRPLVGWTPGPAPHARVACATLQQLRRAAALLRSGEVTPGWGRGPVRVCEHTLAPELQLCCARGLVRSGWVEVPAAAAAPLPAARRVSTCATEHAVAAGRLAPLPDCGDLAPLLFGSFDIEVYSHDGSFPQARRAQDRIIQIGLTLRRYGGAAAPRSVMLCLGETDPVPGVELRVFDTEAALLGGFAAAVAAEDVDVLVGYNIFGFDLGYMAERAGRCRALAGPWPAARAAWAAARARLESGEIELDLWTAKSRRVGLADRLAALLASMETESEARRMWDAVGGADAAVIEPFFHLGRVREDLSFPYAKSMSNAAMGDNTLHLIEMQGRVWFDLYQHIKNNFKLTQYNLNFVSEHFLGDRKLDVPPSQIFALSHHPAGRAKIAAYCAQDCALPLRLLDRLHIVPTLVQMSRVACTDLSDLLTRGQQIKVFQLIATYTHQMGYVINDHSLREFHHLDMDAVRAAAAPLPAGRPGVDRVRALLAELDGRGEGKARDEFEEAVMELSPTMAEAADLKALLRGYEGAVVLEPDVGYHDHPVATLDFASLYPSIMQAHNLCYATLVLPSEAGWRVPQMRAGKVEYETHHVRDKIYHFATGETGVLPHILARLLAERRRVKKQMKGEKDPALHALLDGKQLALKVSCNSVYGFTGVRAGYLPCLPIASTVTTVGRQMIEKTRDAVLARYPGSRVIYGDTDSVMVIFADVTPDAAGVRAAFALGAAAADWITAHTFPSPFITLEMEKVSWPYILFKKKRYAGWVMEHPGDPGHVDAKGLENVRRDNCALLRETLESTQALLLRRRLPDALGALEATLAAVGDRSVDVSKLVMSKTLRSSYAAGAGKLPHVEAVARMRQRADPDVEIPRSGDRVQFLVTRPRDPRAKVFECTEDPAYARKAGLEPHWLYYLDKQLLPPLRRLFQPFDAAVRARIEKAAAAARHRLIRQRDGLRDIRAFFAPAPKRARRA